MITNSQFCVWNRSSLHPLKIYPDNDACIPSSLCVLLKKSLPRWAPSVLTPFTPWWFKIHAKDWGKKSSTAGVWALVLRFWHVIMLIFTIIIYARTHKGCSCVKEMLHAAFLRVAHKSIFYERRAKLYNKLFPRDVRVKDAMMMMINYRRPRLSF